ncbi:hypothetical protein Tco_0814151 [Tanacetum coccineum]
MLILTQVIMRLNVRSTNKSNFDKDKFQEDESMTAFWVINKHFQQFINSKFTLDYDSQMTDNYFVEYTGIEVQHFRDTLLQYLGNVKKSVAERTRHQRQYERRVNKGHMHTQESKIDTGKVVENSLVIMESNGTESEVQDNSSRSGNDTDADDADIRPIYDEEPMAEVQLTAEYNIFEIRQQHTEQPEIIVEGRVDQYPETFQVKSPMLDYSPDNQTTEYSKQSLESENILLKKTVHQSIFRRKQSLDLKVAVPLSNVNKEKSHSMVAEKADISTPLYDRIGKFIRSFVRDNMSIEKIKLFQSLLSVTTAECLQKRQQQLDSTSSTSTLATTVTADGNFDL